MKTIDELHALWQSQLPALTIPVMNRLIAVYPNVLDDVNCPVTWAGSSRTLYLKGTNATPTPSSALTTALAALAAQSVTVTTN